MRLCQRAGLSLPLLTICTVLAGCGTTTVEQPANFSQSPQVVAIYAVDSAFGALPDVLIYSQIPGDQGKISTEAPPSYGSFRVEFDQPVTGTSVANNANVGTTVGGAASFCSPLGATAATPAGTSPIQLLDVDAGSRVVTSSICYDATSALGSHPHVNVVPGAGSLTSTTAKPLTCNTFAPDGGSGSLGDNVFVPKHTYGIKVATGVIANSAGKTLAPPTTTGWTGDTFQFKTSGLKIMAAGYVDANTGFFVWQDKPEVGFEKDLAATPATFQQPTDGSPFLIVLTEPVSNTGTNVTLVRAAPATAAIPDATIGTAGGLLGDPRVIEISPGLSFEPGTAYTVTVAPALAADSGATDTLGGTPKIYNFTAAPGNAESVGITPQNGAQAQPFCAPADCTKIAVAPTEPEIDFSVPIATSGSAPVGTFKLTGPAGDVPLASTDVVANKQVVVLTPSVALTPETTYTISFSGVKSGPELGAALAGRAIPDGTSQFTTQTFRLVRIAASPTSNTNVDRSVAVDPVTALKAGNLTAGFNSTPAGVSPATLTLSEVTPTATTNLNATVTAVAADPTRYQFTVAGYQPKYGQKYEVRAATTVTDTVSQKKLKAEGCTVADCSDVKSFTTRKVTATIRAANTADPTGAAATTPASATGFVVRFSDPMDPATIDLSATQTQFKLFKRDATGALSTNSEPLTCKITQGPPIDPTKATFVTCTATAGLGAAPTNFLASAVFLQTAPVKVLPAVSTDPSAVFFGSAAANIFSPCP